MHEVVFKGGYIIFKENILLFLFTLKQNVVNAK